MLMKDNQLHIRFYADSLGLPRGEEILNDQRYISLLCNHWKEKTNSELFLLDRARGNHKIREILKWLNEDIRYFGNKAEFIILQVGIVDCAPRPIPNYLRNIISRLPRVLRSFAINFLHNNRARIQNFGIKYYYTSTEDFKELYSQFVESASKCAKKVFLVNIAPTNKKTENKSPGLSESIVKYNDIIKEIVGNHKGENVYYVDIYSEIKKHNNIDKYITIEDGHHITIEGHELYAKEILKLDQEADFENI